MKAGPGIEFLFSFRGRLIIHWALNGQDERRRVRHKKKVPEGS